jgi:pimeloyl-ACP methyl ester carboxylesterase
MFDERAYIARLDSADPQELASMLARPTAEQEKTLRVYLGDERYQRMHDLALRRSSTRRAVTVPRGNVVVIPGIMGSELAAVDRGGVQDRIWVQVYRLITGRLDRLRLNAAGLAEYNPDYDVRATGILKRYYGELLLSLSENWRVRAFWFDWRKDLNVSADELRARLSGWFADDAPVHIVAHSMGGLVARTFIKNHPDRWKKMSSSDGRSGGRLIMLGTPNHGSFAIPQAITGVATMVKRLALLDVAHNTTELLQVLNSFVGSYQMLPSPLRVSGMDRLYDAGTYRGLGVSQGRLDNARKHYEELQSVVDPERMLYVAGRDQATFSGINDFDHLDRLEAYDVTVRGDGTVPHELGLLEDVETYYVEEEHGNLTSNARILSALDELLPTGETAQLDQQPVAPRRGREDEATEEEVRKRLIAAREAEEDDLRALVLRNSVRSADQNADTYVSTDERRMEEILTRDFLPHAVHERLEEDRWASLGTPSIEIGLVCGEIEDLRYGSIKSGGGDPVDAISVGHYINVRPQEAELALDRAISKALRGRVGESESDDDLLESDLLLTQYFERGIIRGRLGAPFFLPDPRSGRAERVIAVAGMGLPGGFGAPELTVLARELCWSLGRMEKRHLATVLIGSGKGNIPTREAVSAWMRGIKNAVTGSFEDEGRRLVRVTFVERDPDTVEEIADAIREEKANLEARNRLKVDFREPNKRQIERRRNEEARKSRTGTRDGDEPTERPPTRITLRLEGKTYSFGAITESASVPEREVPLDPALVMEANQELAAESDPLMQSERGSFLGKLLVPAELRSQFSTDAPLVMMLDSTIARIHWEMVAQPELAGGSSETIRRSGKRSEFDPDRFLGTGRGFTRQLRTTFAPPPEPPPPPRRIMRVLVVADPAEDAHLPGAEEEGVEVADLFDSFNVVYEKLSSNRIEVVRLFGPYAATRTNVLRHLMLRSYDVLHFAGHCKYDENPEASGWIFSKGQLISPNELSRIDRVPKFVFSNACESGITPDRSERRSVDLAPSFAERFFERGITNFVCTAWPVDDLAARTFALNLYTNLLGLRRIDERENRYEDTDPRPMYAAMREARHAIAEFPGGARTWGAYQHYGSPYFRFFDPETMKREKAEAGEA